jgi:hypothetical protein
MRAPHPIHDEAAAIARAIGDRPDRIFPSNLAVILKVRAETVECALRAYTGADGRVPASVVWDILSAGLRAMEGDGPAAKRPVAHPRLRQRIVARDGEYCRYCGRKVTWRTRHIDHIVSVKRGGLNLPANLVVACERCNGLKGSRTVEEAGMSLRPSPCGDDALWQVQQRLALGDVQAQFDWPPA